MIESDTRDPSHQAMTRRASRQKRVLIAGFLGTFSILLVVTNLALYRRARSHLDAQLGERLCAVATGIATAVELALPPDSLVSAPPAPFYRAMTGMGDANDLSNVVVLTPDGRTVFDASGLTSPGEANPFVELDGDAVAMARAGEAAYTPLYRTGDVYMKSAYAPVRAHDGTITGIVGVEAGAGFFSRLRELANLIVVISLGNATVVVGLGLLFYRQSRSLDEAEAAMVERENLVTLGRMVATIAHEIRNPLSIIRSSADRIRRRHAIEDDALRYITEEVDELDRVLTGYLEFAKTHPASREPTPLARCVSRTVDALEDEARSRQVTLVATVPDLPLVVTGDEQRLRQAILNVVLNALQAAGAGGHVQVSLDHDAMRAHITVRDDGPGIDPSIRGDILSPFFTTRAGGSGLGLAVVKSVMDEHAGHVEIESPVHDGRGTRVTLVLPLAAGHAATDPKPREA